MDDILAAMAWFEDVIHSIGATTMRTGGDWSPTFRLGDQQCIGPPTSVAVVFKKQEISQQVDTKCDFKNFQG